MARASYSRDPALLARVFALLEATWPGWFQAQAEAGTRWGLDWAACSTPFVREERGALVAHVGVLECETVLAGQRVRVGGVHGVATHPEHRGRGHFRALLDEALAFARPRYSTLILTTHDPTLYARAGFREIQEHRFCTDVHAPAVAAASPRPLDGAEAADVRVLRRCFERREPLNDVCAPLRPDIFYFVEARSPLQYVSALDAVLSYDLAEGQLHLFDVVARSMPSLEEILGRCAPGAVRVACYFHPSKLGGNWTPEPYAFEGPDRLMVHGDWPPGDHPLMWPRTMRW